MIFIFIRIALIILPAQVNFVRVAIASNLSAIQDLGCVGNHNFSAIRILGFPNRFRCTTLVISPRNHDLFVSIELNRLMLDPPTVISVTVTLPKKAGRVS